jgi:hypothetical protein
MPKDDLDEGIEAIIREQDRKVAIVEAFLRLPPKPFEVQAPKWHGELVILVHPDSSDRRRGKWRATRFYKKEAEGHSEYETYEQAVRDVVDGYRVDLSTAKRY